MNNDTISAQAAHYKPTINIAQAPPLAGPALFLISAWISLVVAATRILTNPQQWQTSHLGSSPTLVTVHLVTLGFFTMTMLGTLYQWVPVVFDRPPVPLKMIVFHWFLYTTGLILFLLGFSLHQGMLLATGASLLAVSLIMFSLLIAKRLIQSSRKTDMLSFSLTVALAALNATWIFGLSMALGMAKITAYPNVLSEHLNTAWAGWIVMLVLAVQIKLLPMFSMSRMDPLRPGLPVALAFSGLLVQYAVSVLPGLEVVAVFFWAWASLSVLWQLHRLWHHRQTPHRDGVFAGVVLGWLLWLGAVLSLLFQPELTVFLVGLGAMTFIFSYQSRIIPFLLALFVGRKLPGPVFKTFFMAQRFNSPVLPVITAIWSLVISVLWVIGIENQAPGVLAWAGALLLLWPVFHVLFMAKAVLSAAKTRPNPQGTPEASPSETPDISNERPNQDHE